MEGITQRERRLPGEARARYFAECEKGLRDPDTYNVLAWFLGGLGAHRFYLGQVRKALLHVTLFPVGVALLVVSAAQRVGDLAVIGAVVVVFDVVYWIHDLVKHESIVEDRNNEIRLELLGRYEER